MFGNNSASYHLVEAIYLTATNRFQYWCRLLKQSMTGVTTNHSLLIRVLITRSEIDLGEINNEFSRKLEWGNGKTLKKWICDKSKGSFQHLLLNIAGLHEYNNNACDDDDIKLGIETSADTSIESNGNINLMDGLSTFGVLNDQQPVGVDMPLELEQVDIGDMGVFMIEKMTSQTMSKLWSHIDEDENGCIEADEVLSLMTFTAVLYNAYKNRINGNKDSVKLNKPKVRMHLAPLCNWIETTKMVNQHKNVGKKEFTKLFGAWLKEYAQNHQY